MWTLLAWSFNVLTSMPRTEIQFRAWFREKCHYDALCVLQRIFFFFWLPNFVFREGPSFLSLRFSSLLSFFLLFLLISCSSRYSFLLPFYFYVLGEYTRILLQLRKEFNKRTENQMDLDIAKKRGHRMKRWEGSTAAGSSACEVTEAGPVGAVEDVWS